jgi:carbonic anhydrase/acetyltransferase-like protein (isoleucine patch superfamily)
LGVNHFEMGAASLLDGFVSLKGRRARIGNAVNLQDNDRLLSFGARPRDQGDLRIGDGTFNAHGVTFIGRVRIGEACGTGINAIVQNARVRDGSFVGLVAQVLGSHPQHPIVIPEASLVLFGARIRSQADVAANIIPVPAPFSLFFADVDMENLVLARGFNLLYRAAARMLPFSDGAGDPRNPGDDFPSVAEAFGKISIAPPSIYRRGTGVLPARQATLGDLGFQRFEPMFPTPAPSTPAPDAGGLGLNAPPSDSLESGARFIKPRVASPELIADGAVVLGGCEVASGVEIGPGSYVLGDVAPTVFVGANTKIGRNTSLHELTFTSCRVGERCLIGDRVVLHGPVEIGDDCVVGDGAVLFGPSVRPGVTVGKRALVFGPVEITEDVPDDAIIVAPGNEFLIAPSAPSAATVVAQSSTMLPEWQRAQDAGGAACGCGIGNLLQAAALV